MKLVYRPLQETGQLEQVLQIRIEAESIVWCMRHYESTRTLNPQNTYELLLHLIRGMDSEERQTFLSLLPGSESPINSTRETASIQTSAEDDEYVERALEYGHDFFFGAWTGILSQQEVAVLTLLAKRFAIGAILEADVFSPRIQRIIVNCAKLFLERLKPAEAKPKAENTETHIETKSVSVNRVKADVLDRTIQTEQESKMIETWNKLDSFERKAMLSWFESCAVGKLPANWANQNLYKHCESLIKVYGLDYLRGAINYGFGRDFSYRT